MTQKPRPKGHKIFIERERNRCRECGAVIAKGKLFCLSCDPAATSSLDTDFELTDSLEREGELFRREHEA